MEVLHEEGPHHHPNFDPLFLQSAHVLQKEKHQAAAEQHVDPSQFLLLPLPLSLSLDLPEDLPKKTERVDLPEDFPEGSSFVFPLEDLPPFSPPLALPPAGGCAGSGGR